MYYYITNQLGFKIGRIKIRVTPISTYKNVDIATHCKVIPTASLIPD